VESIREEKRWTIVLDENRCINDTSRGKEVDMVLMGKRWTVFFEEVENCICNRRWAIALTMK